MRSEPAIAREPEYDGQNGAQRPGSDVGSQVCSHRYALGGSEKRQRGALSRARVHSGVRNGGVDGTRLCELPHDRPTSLARCSTLSAASVIHEVGRAVPRGRPDTSPAKPPVASSALRRAGATAVRLRSSP